MMRETTAAAAATTAKGKEKRKTTRLYIHYIYAEAADVCVCVCTGKSDDGDAHDAALPFHKLAGEPSLFLFFLFFSLYSMCVCVYYMCPSAFSHFHPLVTLLLFLVSCRSFYYGGARASAISYRRDDAHISSVCAASRGALAPAAADASTAAPAAQLGTLDGGQPTLDPAAVYISIFFVLSPFGGPARKCPSFSSFFFSFLFVFSVVLIPSLFTRNYQTHKS